MTQEKSWAAREDGSDVAREIRRGLWIVQRYRETRGGLPPVLLSGDDLRGPSDALARARASFG
jgi:hypothetical protein